MVKKFRPLEKHPADMTGEELVAALADLKDAELMRSLIIAEVEAIRDGAPREDRTMRNLWYGLVKPALSRAGLLHAVTRGGNPKAWDALLSKYLVELVRAGVTTYEELRIIDGSRQRQTAASWGIPVRRVELVGAHYPWVILFTEKDTIWDQVEGLASLYGVSAISGGGEPSAACTENTVRAIVENATFQRERPAALVILSLTDYDPFGFHIAEAQRKQAEEALLAIPQEKRGALAEVIHDRLGLYPGQLTPEELDANSYEPKEAGLRAWLEETGGVNGQPLGLELDALPLSRLRAMFAEAIEKHVDIERRREDLRRACVDLLAWDVLGPIVDRYKAELVEAIDEAGLLDAVKSAPIPEDIFKDAAAMGARAVDPVRVGLFEDHAGAIRDVMTRALGEGVS